MGNEQLVQVKDGHEFKEQRRKQCKLPDGCTWRTERLVAPKLESGSNRAPTPYFSVRK
jgi:hypothetical protein